MDKKQVIEIINRFHNILVKNGIKPAKIILFGSFARGNYREDSDIDLVVVSDDFINKGYWERIDILTDAIYEIFEPIEATAMTCDEWEHGDSFIRDFAQDGEVITTS